MAANALIFKDAEKARDAILDSQKKEIANLYSKWADEIGDRANYYKNKTTASSVVAERQMKELQKQLKETSQQVSNEVYSKIKQNIYTVSDSVVKANANWLKDLGFDYKGVNATFSNVPDSTVRKLITGQIYDSGWSLSQRIWSDNQQTMKDAYQVVAKGLAENKPIYDIAKDLENYVRPEARLPWNFKAPDGVKIFKKQVDYNAQRLARTLVQHGYQQSFIEVTEKNPFITEYIWLSNGSRVCPLCMQRDGMHFKKTELPMDHPNGMCTMVPDVSPTMVDDLAKWFNAEDGTYPEIDNFAKNFGYTPSEKVLTREDLQKKYGSSSTGFTPWYKKLSEAQQLEIKSLKEKSGLSWDKWYEKNIYSGEPKVAKSAKMVDAFNDAQKEYLKPYGFTTDNMPATFDDWSHKLSHGKASEILKAMGTDWNDAHPYQKIMEYYNKNLSSKSFVKEVAKVKKKTKVANTTGDLPEYTTWISKMRKQTESYMLDKEDAWLKLIGEDGIRGIKEYTGSSYSEMNGYLRGLQRGLSKSEAISVSGINSRKLKQLDDAINGLGNVRLDEDLILRRGTNLGDIAGAFMDGDFTKNKNLLEDLSTEELNEKFAGAIGHYGAFTSTSSIYDRGFTGNVEVIFYAPKGSNASSIMNISQFGTGEGETLLNTGTNVKCIKIEDSDGHKGSGLRVFMEIIT